MKNRRPMPVVEMNLHEINHRRTEERQRMVDLLETANLRLDYGRALRQLGQTKRGLVRWFWFTLAKRHERVGADLMREVIRIRKAIRSGDDIGLHRITRRALFTQKGR